MERLTNIDSFFKGWAVGLMFVAGVLFTSCTPQCDRIDVLRNGYLDYYYYDCNPYVYYDMETNEEIVKPID